MALRVPFIAQMAAEDCGPACLAMILASHGHHVPLSEVRDRCGAGRSGTTAFDLVMAAKSYGLDAEGLGGIEPEEIEELLEDRGPVILHWGLNHMVVCIRASSTGLALLDPSLGSHEAPWAEANAKVSGVVLTFKGTPRLVPRERGRSVLLRYLGELGSTPAVVGALLIAGLLAQMLSLLPSLAIGPVLSSGAGAPERAVVAGVLGLGLAALAGLLLELFRGIVASRLAAWSNERFYGRVIRRLLSLPLAWIQARGSGELMVRLTQIQRVLGEATLAVVGLTASILTSACALIMLVFIAPVAGAYSLACGLALLLLSHRVAERERIRKRPFLLATGLIGHAAAETQAALPWIEMSGQGPWASERLCRRVQGWRGHVLVASEATFRASFILSAAGGIFQGGLLFVAGTLGLNGRATFGQVAVVVALGSVLQSCLGNLGTSLRALRFAGNTLDRAEDILEAEGEPRQSRVAVLDGAIAINEASFAYWPGGDPVLAAVSLSVRPGEMLGVVGPSGSGKSTLGALLAGVRLPSSGQILLAGIPTTEWDESSLRRQVGYALQAPEILGGSVRLNLALGRELEDRALLDAAAAACLEDCIRKLGGLDALLSPGGLTLSGGERQRLALARALVGRPKLLILDEATSALDLVLEREIHRNLLQFDATRVIITHRRGTLHMADRILTVSGGRLSEGVGDHA